MTAQIDCECNVIDESYIQSHTSLHTHTYALHYTNAVTMQAIVQRFQPYTKFHVLIIGIVHHYGPKPHTINIIYNESSYILVERSSSYCNNLYTTTSCYRHYCYGKS